MTEVNRDGQPWWEGSLVPVSTVRAFPGTAKNYCKNSQMGGFIKGEGGSLNNGKNGR